MGEGIALNFAASGLSVRVVDQNPDILRQSVNRMGFHLKMLAEFGILEDSPVIVRSRIKTFLARDIDKAIKGSTFIVECIPEILTAKKELFSRLDSCESSTILSSNTSSFTISEISEGMRTPWRVIGTHYFMPAHIIPLVEIHYGKDTHKDIIDVTQRLMIRIGKKPILVRKDVTGFVVNRIQAAILREAHYLLEQEVVTPEDLDLAAKSSYGFRLTSLGPIAQVDINGLDTVLRATTNIYKSLSNATEPSWIISEKVNKGDIGLKSGKGLYDYSGKAKEEISREIERNLLKQLILFREREK